MTRIIRILKSEIIYWTINDVQDYATAVINTTPEFLDQVCKFIVLNKIDGNKLLWLVSLPFEKGLNQANPNISGKLKNLDQKLWKGIRWKYLLDPISDIYNATDGSELVITLDSNKCIKVEILSSTRYVKPKELINRVYTINMYDTELRYDMI